MELTEEQIEENKETFVNHWRKVVTRDGSEELLQYMEENGMFTQPASTKFHLSCKGGLCQHSLNVCRELYRLAHIYAPKEYTDETLTIVSLAHDLCKCGIYKPGTRNVKNEDTGKWEAVNVWKFENKHYLGHGSGSVVEILMHMHLTQTEAEAIFAHMGAYDQSVKGGDYTISEIHDRNKLAVLLHVADLLASKLFEE